MSPMPEVMSPSCRPLSPLVRQVMLDVQSSKDDLMALAATSEDISAAETGLEAARRRATASSEDRAAHEAILNWQHAV